MARDRPYIFAMNGGEVSPRALARVDLKRMAISAETMINCFPRVIGAMQFRGGLGYSGETPGDAQVKQIPFIFAADDTAMVELSDLAMQVAVNGATVTRVAVATVITNGDFSSAVGWTLTTTGNGGAAISGGKLKLNGWARGSTNLAKRSTAVAGGDLNKEHGLRITIDRGPVTFRCGSTDGGEELIPETTLNTGVYSMAFTPTASPFWVQFSGIVEREVVVDSITIEAAGAMTLPAPWPTANLRKCRYDQSGDVIFVANSSRLYQTRRIERRDAASRSWGIAIHEILDGPFRGKTGNVGLDLQVVPALNGAPTDFVASDNFFKPTHVGSLFRLYNSFSAAVNELSDNDRWTDSIRISGNTNAERQFTWTTVNGLGGVPWVGTLSLMASYDEGLTWTDVGVTRAANGTAGGFVVGVANTIVHVRVGFKAGSYVSGVSRNSLVYAGGGGWGVVRVTSYTSATTVKVDVVKRVHNFSETSEWEEGAFSDINGWPSAVALFDGRLWLGSKEKINGSISDDFSSMDIDEDGDSGPIIRSIAVGPVNRALWMLGLSRLVIGTSGAEPVVRSTSFDEVLTPTNFSIKDVSNLGSADVAGVKIDKAGLFIQRNGRRAYLISFSVDDQDYSSSDISRYHPDILEATVIGVAVQRQPDTRIWFALNDGTAACLIWERDEEVISWCRFTTDGLIEDIAILPNTEADDVYMIVNRTINGATKRYREKLAYDTQAQGGTDNYIADSFWTQDLVATATMTGGAHLALENVVVWVNGTPILTDPDADGVQEARTFTVDGLGQITLDQAYTGKAIAGLAYEGRWKSSKLAYAAAQGTSISQKKQVLGAQPVLYKTHNKGILFGQDFTAMVPLPEKYREVDLGETVVEEWDDDQFALPGEWSNDARICIKMRAPMPAQVLAMVLKMEAHENG